ncbi:hypothetical protein HYX11_02720 [Candidatus Woesearchaeota archaeon]|nr:hypothetical protein [Candidatus Woesearchaeota archaeon]
MSLPEQKWWQKLFKKSFEPRIDSIKDIDAIIEFLKDSNNDTKILLKDLEKLRELEKERLVAHTGIIHINIETQAKILDQLLERYEFLENDTSINGIRLKYITNELLKQAKKNGLTDLVKKKKNNPHWQFQW